MPPSVASLPTKGDNMKVRASILLGLLALSDHLKATICATLPPCTLARPGSILFVGRFIHGASSAELAKLPTGEVLLQYRVRVLESFVGLAPGTEQVQVVLSQSRQAGETYFFDAIAKGREIYLTTCGASGSLTDSRVADAVRFLRKAQRSGAVGSASVRVLNASTWEPLDDAIVSLDGPTHREAKTGGGYADFRALPQGDYTFVVSKPGFEVSRPFRPIGQIKIIADGCASADIALQPVKSGPEKR